MGSPLLLLIYAHARLLIEEFTEEFDGHFHVCSAQKDEVALLDFNADESGMTVKQTVKNLHAFASYSGRYLSTDGDCQTGIGISPK